MVAEGFPLFHGAHLAIDTTLVSPFRVDGALHIGYADVDGAALRQVRRRKERTYRELRGVHGRAKLVVLAAEVGGRWSLEAQTFLRLLVRAKTRSLLEVFQVRARQAWLFRWSSLLACSAVRAFVSSLFELHGCLGADGPAPSTSSVFDGCRMPRDSVWFRVFARLIVVSEGQIPLSFIPEKKKRAL